MGKPPAVCRRSGTVDALLRSSGFKMGTIELMDYFGLDANFAVSQSVYHAVFEEPRYRLHPICRGLDEANSLGCKISRGFHDYTRK